MWGRQGQPSCPPPQAKQLCFCATVLVKKNLYLKQMLTSQLNNPKTHKDWKLRNTWMLYYLQNNLCIHPGDLSWQSFSHKERTIPFFLNFYAAVKLKAQKSVTLSLYLFIFNLLNLSFPRKFKNIYKENILRLFLILPSGHKQYNDFYRDLRIDFGFI